MKKENIEIKFLHFEEDDNFRVENAYDSKHDIKVFLLTETFPLCTIICLLTFALIRDNVLLSAVICIAIFCFFLMFAYLCSSLIPIRHLRYLLVVGRNGIKNRTSKGEVLIKWQEFSSVGIINATVSGTFSSRSIQRMFVCVSNSAFDETRFKRFIKKPESNYFIGENSEILIAVVVSGLEEAEDLKSKIQEYADKYAAKDDVVA